MKLAFPEASVVTVVVPMRVCPWPCPEGSAVGLAKNCRVNEALAALFSEPSMTVVPAVKPMAPLSTG
jgi:hypothetical protein